ncbi:MAG: hypothetical protein KA257_02520 [Opitutaceae bacterium]|nr:hypothetical protein [Opitutaceae bacterium]MBP9899810.1 hypothetical protein [Verrucomicrobiota bacterium]
MQKTWELKIGKDTMVYNRVAPPVARTTVLPTAVLPNFSEQPDTRRQVFLSLTAYVYEGVTELVWTDPESDGERLHRALSNVDFSFFPMQFDYRTEDTHYAATVMVFNFGSGLAADLTRSGAHAAALASLRGKSGYDFVEVAGGGAMASATDLELLDALHAYYKVNRTQLKAAADQRTQQAAEEARIQAEEALKPKTITVNYWRESDGPATQP